MDLEISGFGKFRIEYVVFDLNGSLAVDGTISDVVKTQLKELAKYLTIFIASADIHGNLQAIAESLGIRYVRLNPGNTATEKQKLVDDEMLKQAAIGIAVMGPEEASVKAIVSSDIVVRDIRDAIDCLLNPLRIIATLRD